MVPYILVFECVMRALKIIAYIWGKMERVRVAGNIASAPWVSVLEPGSSQISVLLVHNMLNVRAVFLDIVRVHDAGNPRADRDDFQTSIPRVIEDRVGYSGLFRIPFIEQVGCDVGLSHLEQTKEKVT